MSIILASGSVRRKNLLKKVGVNFIISPAQIEEHHDTNLTPEKLSTHLAEQKAFDVCTRASNSLIIAADTIVSCDGELLGKPSDKDAARNMLSILSGNSHSVITGVTFVKADKAGNSEANLSFHEVTKVYFHSLDLYNLDMYLDSDIPYDKAGGYGIQNGWGALFVESIDGDYYNVVGLPLQKVMIKLKTFAPEYLNTNYLL